MAAGLNHMIPSREKKRELEGMKIADLKLTKNEKEMLRQFFSFRKISCATVLKMQFGI